MTRGAKMLASLGALVAATGSTTMAAPGHQSTDESELITFLDQETKPSLLSIGKYGRLPDGNFVVSATFHRELGMPLNKLTKFCNTGGGNMNLLVSAAAIFPKTTGSADLVFDGETFNVDQSDLFEWSGQPRSASADPALNGFEAVFDRRLVTGRTRTIADANANPPLGLFGCVDVDSNLKWAVSIMAGSYGGNSWLYVKILPVTYELLSARREATIAAKRNEEDWKRAQAEKQREAEAFANAENIRLAPWRKALAIGSQTNCGLVINDRGAVLEIQLPSGHTGPSGERQFWARRDELTDYVFPKECTFGR
jgi:hypothetical protein